MDQASTWVIAGLGELLQKPGGSWEDTESCLFAMSCLASTFINQQAGLTTPEEHSALGSLLGSDKVLGTPPGAGLESLHPLLLVAMAKLIQSFAEWFVRFGSTLLQPAMLFCLATLSSQAALQAPHVALAVAKAFSSLSVRAAKLLATEQSIGEIVGRLLPSALVHIDLEARVLVTESLGRLAVLLPLHQCQKVVESIVQPNLERIKAIAAILVPGALNREASARATVEELRLLCGSIRFLEFPVAGNVANLASPRSPNGTPINASQFAVKEAHPTLVVLQTAMPSIRHFAQAFAGHSGVVEAICELFRRGLGSAREALLELLPSVMEIVLALFQGGKYPECLEVCGVSVEVFGFNEASTNDFAQLASTVSNEVFAAAQLDLGGRPEMIAAYFDFLGKLVIFNAKAILLQPGVFGVVCELSGAVLSLPNRDVLRSLLVFLAHVSTPHLAADTAIGDAVRTQMGSSGLAIVKAGLLAASDTMGVELVPRLTDTLLALVKMAPNEVAQCAVEILSMPHLQKGQFTDEDRRLFCALLVDQELLAKPRRYKSMMSDFAKICQNQGTADALVAYQL